MVVLACSSCHCTPCYFSNCTATHGIGGGCRLFPCCVLCLYACIIIRIRI